MKSAILSERERRRFTEQIKLPSVGIQGQEKLKKSKVLVIGVGGKGTALLQNLTASGIGTIGISDNFTVEEALLPRQSLYGDHDIGKQKAIISKQRLSQISKSVHFELHNICLSEDNILQIFENYDLIADATDNFAAHYLINDAAIMQDKTVVYGAVYHRKGMVAVFNHDSGPSFRCLFPKKPHKSQDSVDEDINGSSVLYHLTGTLMANEVLAVLLGNRVTLSGKMLVFDASDYHLSMEAITKKPENFTRTGFTT
jgi:adenylyltransferase/sulfurtransferase